MQNRSTTLPFQASLVLLFTALLGLGNNLPASAHPYQEYSQAQYAADQAKWRDRIKRDPKNPAFYLELAASHHSEAAEGYWCETSAIAVYREAIARVPPNAEIHQRLGITLLAETPVRCDEPDPITRQAEKQEGLLHLRKAITIAAESASDETLLKAAELLIQPPKQVQP